MSEYPKIIERPYKVFTGESEDYELVKIKRVDGQG